MLIRHRFTSFMPNAGLIAMCRFCPRWRMNFAHISTGAKPDSYLRATGRLAIQPARCNRLNDLCAHRRHQETRLSAPAPAFHSDYPARFRTRAYRPATEVLGTPGPFNYADLRRNQPARSGRQLHPGLGRDALVPTLPIFHLLLGGRFKALRWNLKRSLFGITRQERI